MVNRNSKHLFWLPSYASNDMTGWSQRHLSAIARPNDSFESAVVPLLRAWLDYADAHQNAYGSEIGEDSMLGPNWARIGSGLRGLLDGNIGRLDANTLDRILVNTLTDQGFDPDVV